MRVKLGLKERKIHVTRIFIDGFFRGRYLILNLGLRHQLISNGTCGIINQGLFHRHRAVLVLVQEIHSHPIDLVSSKRSSHLPLIENGLVASLHLLKAKKSTKQAMEVARSHYGESTPHKSILLDRFNRFLAMNGTGIST